MRVLFARNSADFENHSFSLPVDYSNPLRGSLYQLQLLHDFVVEEFESSFLDTPVKDGPGKRVRSPIAAMTCSASVKRNFGILSGHPAN